VQAVQNVLAGRYKLVTTQLMDYCMGLYGKPPSPIDPDVKNTVLKSRRGKEQVECRPADLLQPEMEAAREAVKDISKETGDVLTAAMYPATGLRFLKWKYGLKTPPPEVMAAKGK
jgi:pyruvate carboxylase subunit B